MKMWLRKWELNTNPFIPTGGIYLLSGRVAFLKPLILSILEKSNRFLNCSFVSANPQIQPKTDFVWLFVDVLFIKTIQYEGYLSIYFWIKNNTRATCRSTFELITITVMSRNTI